MTPAGRRILVLNTGSSSVKIRVVDDGDEVRYQADIPPLGDGDAGTVLEERLPAIGAVDAVGHRVVHGGERFRGSVLLDGAVEDGLEGVADLAPLHNPPGVQVIRAARRALHAPQVVCFDTAFHAHLPDEASVYAVPEEWRQRWGIRRYGFHGLSHAHAVRRAATLVGRDVAELRIVSCHLGAGASLCAVLGGRSVDTTMGFTPLDGLVMATRSGSVDPGALLWLQRRAGLGAGDVEDALERGSGLLGLSGLGSSPRELYPAADAGHAGARLALDVYLHRLSGLVAAMTSALNGIDVLVFTGGVGENSARLRADAVSRLAWLGLGLDRRRNEGVSGDGVVSPGAQVPAACVVRSREDLEIAREVRRVLAWSTTS